MKIAFVIEYFFPFDKGGSEWSTYYLAKSLVKKGHKVTIVTPNYGSKKHESLEGIKIQRLPLYKKVKNFDKIPGNFFFTNPLYILWNAFFLTLYLKKSKYQIIHIQGKYSLLPARIANLFLKLPIVVTIRDYLPICAYGICLMKSNKACGLIDYYKKDFKKYYEVYVLNKSTLSLIFNLIASVWGRTSTYMLRKATKGIKVVVLSQTQKRIYEENGYKNIESIYNPFEFKRVDIIKKQEVVTFAGRLTPGKGVNLLESVAVDFTKKHPNFKFLFIGEGFLKKKLQNIAKNHNQIRVLGNISHKDLIDIFSKSKVVLAPSVWPEPFGRVVLEAIACKTPALVGERNGLAAEINGRWGIASKHTSKDVLANLEMLIAKNTIYHKKIINDYPKIKRTFGSDVTKKYVSIYRRLLK